VVEVIVKERVFTLFIGLKAAILVLKWPIWCLNGKSVQTQFWIADFGLRIQKNKRYQSIEDFRIKPESHISGFSFRHYLRKWL